MALPHSFACMGGPPMRNGPGEPHAWGDLQLTSQGPEHLSGVHLTCYFSSTHAQTDWKARPLLCCMNAQRLNLQHSCVWLSRHSLSFFFYRGLCWAESPAPSSSSRHRRLDQQASHLLHPFEKHLPGSCVPWFDPTLPGPEEGS